MTVVTALVVVYAMDEFGDLDAGLGFLVACFLAAGAIQVLMGIFRLGVSSVTSLIQFSQDS